MNTTTIIITAVVLAVAVMFAILVATIAQRKRSERLQGHFGTEYDHTVETMGDEKKAQTELDNRQKHVDTLNIRPLSPEERERYQADWTAMQAKFVDEPRRATIEADQLIMEVMQLRDYPVSDFEQRAADISVNYPVLVTNYRAAQETAIRNDNHHAGTEDLRQAMINYRSVFDELLKTDEVALEIEKV